MIPDFLVRSCFWDCDPQSVDPAAHRRFVVERVMEFGDDEAIKWLLSTYSHEDLADVLRGSRQLSAKTVTCWANYLGLQEEEAVACMPKSCRPEDAPFFQP